MKRSREDNPETDLVTRIMAIDVHGHFGRCDRPENAWATRLQTADVDTVVRRATAARIEMTVVSPLRSLMPRGHADVVGGNDEAEALVAGNDALLQWAVVDPRCPASFEQADRLLKGAKCPGIKIHPEEHLYPIREFGDRLFSFAAERRAIILTHSGEANSMPADFLPFADAYPEVRLILAHIGCGYDEDMGHQVRAVMKARHRNVWADTSSAVSITPNLIEWAVSEGGADRVLFGTDSPLYAAAMQRARIDHADLSLADKQRILRGNAAELLGLGQHENGNENSMS